MVKELSNLNICHVTSSHPYKDIRIYWRECSQIRQYVGSVSLVCPAPKAEMTEEGIQIIPFVDSIPNGWSARIRAAALAAKIAESLDADLYHFHDVELVVPMAWLAYRTGKPVVFDVHEHYRATIAQDRGLLGKAVAAVYDLVERWAIRKFAGVVSVTPTILAFYQNRVRHAAIIRNFADVDNILRAVPQLPKPVPQRCFFSGTMPEKSLFVLADTFSELQHEFPGIEVHVAGRFDTPEDKVNLEQYWNQRGVGHRLQLLGYIPHEELLSYASQCSVGLVLFWPWENVMASEPNKIFEYMALGLPVITPDSENYRRLLLECECGIVTDTASGKAIANAIRHLFSNPHEIARMRECGRATALEKYQMKFEGPKLVELYQKILQGI